MSLKYPRIIQVSHNDLDGIGCTILLRKALSDQMTDSYNVDYKEVVGVVNDLRRDCWLILTDLSPPPELIPILREFTKVTLIDHHETSKCFTLPEFSDMDVLVDMGHCATFHCIAWLQRSGIIIPPNTSLRDWYWEWARIVNSYDMWILDTPDARRLNALWYMSNKYPQTFIDNALKYLPTEMIDQKREAVDKYIAIEDAYVNKVKVWNKTEPGSDIKIGVAFAEKSSSLIGDRILRREGYDIAYVINMTYGSVSIRSAKYDCSLIAKKFGGGGHKVASGFQITDNQYNLMIDMMELPTWDVHTMNEPREEYV